MRSALPDGQGETAVFREMKRKRQLLSREESESILARGTSGVLALSGEGGWPYAVPLSYLYTAGKIYFHCAKEGYKMEAIARDSRASFCVIDRDQVVPEKMTTYFRSAIAFGRIRVVEDEDAKKKALRALGSRYSAPGNSAAVEKEVEQQLPQVCILEFTVEQLTGKESIELVKARGG